MRPYPRDYQDLPRLRRGQSHLHHQRLHALQLGGFFLPDNQRALVGELPIELRYLFASESGVTHSSSSSRTLAYWAKYFAKEGTR